MGLITLKNVQLSLLLVLNADFNTVGISVLLVLIFKAPWNHTLCFYYFLVKSVFKHHCCFTICLWNMKLIWWWVWSKRIYITFVHLSTWWFQRWKLTCLLLLRINRFGAGKEFLLKTWQLILFTVFKVWVKISIGIGFIVLVAKGDTTDESTF